jgi:CheY-like chemotaxis protein
MPAGDDNAGLFDARLLKPARQAQLCDTLARCLASDHQPLVAVAEKAGTRRHVTLLVADDNPVNLKVACAMLARLGYDTRTAADGAQAVAEVAAAMRAGSGFGAVLMDVNMPVLDGLEATRQILAAWGGRAPPVIALTAAALPEDQARCVAAGMVDYLTKPLHVPALTRVLERWAVGAAPASAPPAPTPGPATPPLMDFSRLEEFREFDDEELSMTRAVVDLFLADAPARLAAIAAALAAGDAAALSVAAHALKGSAGNIGATAVMAHCARLEADTASGGLPADADARLARLQALWDDTRAALAGWPAGTAD